MYVTYRDVFHTWENKTIYEIVAEDLKVNGTGSRVKIINCGLGFNRVEMKVTSEFNRGIYYLIKLFGH